MKYISTHPCQYHEKCSGCTLWHLPQEKHLDYKQQKMLSFLREKKVELKNTIKMIGPDQIGYRDRVDISLIDGKLGFFSKTSERKEIVDIDHCPILSKNLDSFFGDFKDYIKSHKDKLLSYKFSFRLRISPNNDRGLWIDTSHETVKYLFEEQEFLRGLLEKGIQIEIGQKLKPLYINSSNELKLSKETKSNVWFETYSEDNKKYSIYSEIGAFTQPGFLTNKIMMNEVHRLISLLEYECGKFENLIELFSGSGNFTLAFLSRGLNVFSYESFIGAKNNLERALSDYPEFRSKIEFKRLNLYSKELKNEVNFLPNSILFVDPPRSGIGRVFDLLLDTSAQIRPTFFLYVSCEPKALVDDIARLKDLGYEIQSLTGLDQFMYSEHSEWICLLKKVN